MRAPLEDFFAKRAALFAIRVAKTFSGARSSRRRKFRHFGMRAPDRLFLETGKKQNYISSQQYARAAL
jgi:hypothetical protein